MNEYVKVQVGSNNIFADLDLPNPEERLVKAELAIRINNIIPQRNLTQDEPVKILDIDRAKLSALTTGKLQGYFILNGNVMMVV